MTTSYENYNSEKCNQYDAQGRRAVCLDELMAEMPPNCVVLDAGCGTGNYMVPLVTSGKVESYTGIDYSTAMLACIQKKIDALGRDGVKAFQHSLHDTLPFEDNTFDVILHNQVMHHLVYPENQDPLASVRRYLTEFYRVLKRGGLLAINYCTPTNLTSYWWILGDVHDKMVQYIPDTDTIVELLKGAGFGGEEIRHFTDAKPLHGEQHFAYERCFDEDYRKADSAWALMSEKQLTGFLEKMEGVLGDKETRIQFDEGQRSILNEFGATTEIFARK